MPRPVQINKPDTAARTGPYLSEAVKQGIARVAEMTRCYHIAEQALHILRHLAKKWNIDVHIETGAPLDPKEYKRLSRLFGGIAGFSSSIIVAQDSVSDSITDKDVREATACQPGKGVENLEDLPLLPSAMPGHPMCPKEKALEEAGFAVL